MSKFIFGSPDFRSGASSIGTEMRRPLKSPTCDSSAKEIPLRPIRLKVQSVSLPRRPGERDSLLKSFSTLKDALSPTALRSRISQPRLSFWFDLGRGVNHNLPLFA